MLFDLDGTLIDTAPDLIDVANTIRTSFDLPELSPEHYRSRVSNGIAALLDIALQSSGHSPGDPILTQRFLMLYESRICDLSAPFEGIPELLAELELWNITWGVVTNKALHLANALLDALHLSSRMACIVAGGSTDRPKPAADPLLHACTQLTLRPSEVVYLGDSIHDIHAACRAHIRSAIAGWGYLDVTDQPETWGAEVILNSPSGVLPWIGLTPVKQRGRRPE